MFKRLIQIFAIALFAGVMAGCIETKKEVTLNPDGSGKIVYKAVRPLEGNMNMSFGNMKKKEETPEEKAKKEALAFLEKSEGVDAWEDVSYKVNDIGKLEFQGTAYFKSFNKVKIGGSIKSDNNIKLKKTGKGLTLSFKSKSKKKKQASAEKLSGAELDKQVKIEQAKMQQTMGMMGAMLNGFKDVQVFHLPGKISTITNLKKINDSTAEMVLDGDKILKVMREFAADKKAIKEILASGQDLKNGPPEEYLNEKMFGNNKTPEVIVTGDLQPAFNYQKAVEKAKKNYPAMCKKLGLEVKEPIKLPKKVEGNVTGKIHGNPFDMEQAYIQNNILHLRTGKDFFADQEIVIFLMLKQGEKFDGKKFNITEKSGFGSPHIHMKYKVPGKNLPKTEMFMSKYVMDLELKKRQGKTVKGSIYLLLPDEKKSSISGDFEAEIK